MKIAIHPYEPNFDNKYIERMVEAIRLAYPDVQIASFSGRTDVFCLIGYDYVWLNWYENPTRRFKAINFCLKVLNILILKILGIKVITTFHNRKAHEAKDSIWDKYLFDMIFKLSNKILILSSVSREILKEKYGDAILRKAFLIPHPTYDCEPKRNADNTQDFSILFFGHLRPYKNIELIFEVAKQNKDIKFTIAGKPWDGEYEVYLRKAAEAMPNVTLIPHFISSSEMDELIESHSILILPYDIESSLNSGVVIHSICKGINMIIPEIGTVTDLNNRDKIFSYTYNSPEEHLTRLNEMVKYAKKEYKNNYNGFVNRISLLYEEIISNQTPKKLSIKLKELFS